MIRLYCYECSGLHEFLPAAVERLLYTLQGVAADAAVAPALPVAAEQATVCLRETLRQSWDAEGYAEWTGCLVGLRERAEPPWVGRMGRIVRAAERFVDAAREFPAEEVDEGSGWAAGEALTCLVDALEVLGDE